MTFSQVSFSHFQLVGIHFALDINTKLIYRKIFVMLHEMETIFVRGGIMMVPLAVCSFLVVLLTVERMFMLRRNRQVPNKSTDDWRDWILNMGGNPGLPQPDHASLVGRIMSKTVGNLPLPRERLEERLGDLARVEKHRLERGLVILDTIAGIAPLFGLLGTALGMVEVFSRLSLLEEAKMNALSSGISQALFTTVAGLIIGIPSLIAFNLFSRQVESLMISAEDQVNTVVDSCYARFVAE